MLDKELKAEAHAHQISKDKLLALQGEQDEQQLQLQNLATLLKKEKTLTSQLQHEKAASWISRGGGDPSVISELQVACPAEELPVVSDKECSRLQDELGRLWGRFNELQAVNATLEHAVTKGDSKLRQENAALRCDVQDARAAQDDGSSKRLEQENADLRLELAGVRGEMTYTASLHAKDAEMRALEASMRLEKTQGELKDAEEQTRRCEAKIAVLEAENVAARGMAEKLSSVKHDRDQLKEGELAAKHHQMELAMVRTQLDDEKRHTALQLDTEKALRAQLESGQQANLASVSISSSSKSIDTVCSSIVTVFSHHIVIANVLIKCVCCRQGSCRRLSFKVPKSFLKHS